MGTDHSITRTFESGDIVRNMGILVNRQRDTGVVVLFHEIGVAVCGTWEVWPCKEVIIASAAANIQIEIGKRFITADMRHLNHRADWCTKQHLNH